MMGRGHAVSGLALWLAGWAWTAEAGLGHPHLDVLTVGTLVCAGGALFPDLDHPNSRLAHSGGPLTRLIAKGVGRFHKPTVVALLCAAGSFALVPADVWWLGLAVGVGCFTHLLGDLITASGCPILWPVPIPSRVQRYDARARQRVPQRVWRTWYLVGTPQWMRFRVGSPAEDVVTWCLVVAGVAAVAGLVYAGGWGPAAHG
jgi:hypothetical protein